MRLKYIFDATKRQKETITNWAIKAGKNPEEVIHWAESSFDKDAEQLAAAKWYVNNKDTSTFKQALYICTQKKLDPLKQDPEALVSENIDLKPKEKPINPDDVLADRNDEGNSIVTYAARDEDREILRQIINTHFGNDANPWCLLASEDGKLTEESEDYWYRYDAYPKRIAFRNDKLLAFSAGTNKNVREWWDRFDRSFPFIPYNGKAWVGCDNSQYEIKNGEVFKTDSNSRNRLLNSYSSSIEESEADVSVSGNKLAWSEADDNFIISKEDDKYYYVDDQHAKLKVDKDTLRIEGPYELYYDNHQLRESCSYKDGKKEGKFISYSPDGSIEYEGCYKNGKLFNAYR